MIDWDGIQERTGWCEADWRVEVSVENPQCSMLNRNGNLPNSGNGQKRIFEQECDFCFLWQSPPSEYPACPWAATMAEELTESREI